MRAREFITDDLHKWFKEKWVRFGPDGKIRGSCARGSKSEGKPKCLPQSKAYALGKKGRASAASRKRREDPNPERKGKAKNVKTVTENNGTDHQKIMHHTDGEPITVTNVNGQITVSSKHGEIKAYVKNDAVVVTGSFVEETQQGQGYGVDLYEVLADTAFSLDKVLVSDRSVTVQAAGAWRALARRGYTIWANYVEGVAPDRVGGGGASPMGLNPFVAIPPGMDLTYAQAVGMLLSPNLRAVQGEMSDEINKGAVKLSGMKENFADGRGPGRPSNSVQGSIFENTTTAHLKKIKSDPTSSKRKKQSEAPRGVIFDGNKVFVGKGHMEPLVLSDQIVERIKKIGNQYGYWYEGAGGDVPSTTGFSDISKYEGSFDEKFENSIKGTPPEFYYVIFSNVTVNHTVRRITNPQLSIFDSILHGYTEENKKWYSYYISHAKPKADTLEKFLKMCSDDQYNFLEMSKMKATKENVTKFLRTGEQRMWPDKDWEKYPYPAGKVAKKANDQRDIYLLKQNAGVYFIGAGHLLGLLRLDDSLKMIGGEKANT